MLKFTLVLFFSILSVADVKPTTPEPGEDLVLTKGQKAELFFESRKQDSQCRSSWEATNRQFQDLDGQLRELLLKKAPASQSDKKEQEMVAVRTKLLELTEQCGPCATQEVDIKTVDLSTHSEYWYVSDGSCFNPVPAEDGQNRAFDKSMDFLLNTGGYARQRGGFESVLEFFPVDRKTGEQLPQIEKVDTSQPLSTFIAVRGPGRIAFNYVFENHFENRELSNGLREFILKFNGYERPEGFSPDIFDYTFAGTKRKILMRWNITRVQGMWYIRSDGYYRYFTAADFESPLKIGTTFARKTLLDTVLTLSERGKQ